MSEHFKALMRQGRMASRPGREALTNVSGAEQAKQVDSIRCPNCSHTLGIAPDLTEDNTDPFMLKPGLDVYVTEADPIIDGERDTEENGGKVIVCWFCGYDVTDPVHAFYGDAPNA